MSHSKVIKLDDGTSVEVDVRDGHPGATTPTVKRDWGQVESVLRHVSGPFLNVYRELSRDLEGAELELELGLAFEPDGGLFIAKSRGTANLKATIKLKPPRSPTS